MTPKCESEVIFFLAKINFQIKKKKEKEREKVKDCHGLAEK